ncbi:MAG: family 20 glycosylhydrolase [Flavobacteriaceae bacterium]|nr:family 20 glycosylhydrolase [Flavobacteriaceae bacterium]
MKGQIYSILLVILFCFNNCTEVSKPVPANIIPKPNKVVLGEGTFILSKSTTISAVKKLEPIVNYFKNYVSEKFDIEINTSDEADIQFQLDTSLQNDEAYNLTINEDKILIKSKTQKGAFYAIQSLLQLMPYATNKSAIAINCISVNDAPRFSYRGMHLDVARHFFSVDFIKKYLDLMAMLKMNTFHWHLTEDQGWRIEIKQYPKLQEIAAFRNETLIGHYSDQPHKFDGKKYGGFYTQEDIKEIVAYASDRQITVIPEIEMPGHSQAAIAAYPELGCTGNQIEVATKWGVFEDIYCPKEITFTFLENVIDEVVNLFPGKYIHIGGDEAPKTRWKNCTHCQQLIKKEGLKDEHELQSYFITRMEKYINSKGKQIIGWDEILEGGLAPNATVMSWRGTNGAVEAAKEHHDVILTPGSHCYFDHYQSDDENEPLAIGGYLPLEKVYNFEPIPSELNNEESKYVLGAQGNVWTEYITTPEQIEYMILPRAAALSEVVWTKKTQKNYKDFVERLVYFNKYLDEKEVNYANHIYYIKGKLINKNGKLFYELTTTTNNTIFYSLTDENMNIEYKSPIEITNSATINAAVFDENQQKLGRMFTESITIHKAVGANISLNVTPHKSYNAGGKQALINGISGNNKRYGDVEWLGFSGDDVEITIQFEKPISIQKINTRFHNGNGQWIYAPQKIAIQFNDEKSMNFNIENYGELLVNFSQKFDEEKVNSLKITIPNYGKIPEGRQGAGYKAWTFIDEIIIE